MSIKSILKVYKYNLEERDAVYYFQLLDGLGQALTPLLKVKIEKGLGFAYGGCR